MVNRLATRLRAEQGFTLIELLVVIIILGILLAIAVPSYLSFKDRANKSAAQANVRAVLPDIESYNADNTVGNTQNDPDTAVDATHSDSGYQGMTAALLKSGYDQAFPSSVFTYPGDAATAGAPTGTGITAVGTGRDRLLHRLDQRLLLRLEARAGRHDPRRTGRRQGLHDDAVTHAGRHGSILLRGWQRRRRVRRLRPFSDGSA